jgi:Na+-driven multidrug efflux pump
MVIAWRDPSSLTEYASSPTPFWMVKLMDLGIIVPAALATGIGVLRGAAWARRGMYAMLTGYTSLAIAVAAMGLFMYVNDDPDASLGLAGGFGIFAGPFVTLTTLLYRPFFAHRRSVHDGPAGRRGAPADSLTTTAAADGPG